MINVYTEGRINNDYDNFIDDVIMAIFPEDAKYDIYIEAKKFVDKDGTHAGFCTGDELDAKQFCRGQINMVDNVWKHNNLVLDCDHVDYIDLPWEVEAYGYETILTDIYWGNDQ